MSGKIQTCKGAIHEMSEKLYLIKTDMHWPSSKRYQKISATYLGPQPVLWIET